MPLSSSRRNVFVAFGEAAALDVGVGELVDEGDLRRAREDGVDVHLGEERALIFDFAAGDLVEFAGELGGAAAAVSLDNADDDVLAAAAPAQALAEHAEGFADPWSVAEEDFEAAARRAVGLRIRGEQPVLWSLACRRRLAGRCFAGWFPCVAHAVRYTL